MIKKKILVLCIISFLILKTIRPSINLKEGIHKNKHDLAIVGHPFFADGLGRLPILFIDMLKNYLNINFINSMPYKINVKDINSDVIKVIQSTDRSLSKVVLFTDLLWAIGIEKNFDSLLRGRIKIAYSMLESTAIPQKWTSILNNKFDAVIVPDPFVKQVYLTSGVTIPIFILPFNLYLEKFFKKPIKTNSKFYRNKPFIFGSSSVFDIRKDQGLLVDAFAQEFGNSNKVYLKLHGRPGDPNVTKKLRSKIKKYNYKNIQLIEKRFTEEEYINFMSLLHCYVFTSRGEGFSITPREAMALGIPCILTNNSSHITICNSGLVRPLKCPIIGKAYYKILGGFIGTNRATTVSEVRVALREIYVNYKYWLKKSKRGREWVKQYLSDRLRPYYLSLVHPNQIFLGKDNIITPDYIMTNSKKLYNKYKN